MHLRRLSDEQNITLLLYLLFQDGVTRKIHPQGWTTGTLWIRSFETKVYHETIID